MRKTVKQCKTCPWRMDVVPERDIPNCYCATKHRNLKSTIAEPGRVSMSEARKMMACHESTTGDEFPCVGWLANQLGPGNNIPLRIMMVKGLLPDFKLVGEQHERFEDTLPSER